MPDYDIPPTINGSVVSTSSGTTATKPRRKRKKKKKKKKTAVSEPSIDNDCSDDDDDGDFGVVMRNKDNTNGKSKTASNISTPQELLRRRLIEIDGYEATQVEQAMEDMWDKGMPYDEYDSVVLYLSQLSYMSRQLQLSQTSDVDDICGTTAASMGAYSYSNSVLTASTKEAEEEETDFTATRLDADYDDADDRLLQDDFLEPTTNPINVEETVNDAQDDGNEEEPQQEQQYCEKGDNEESAIPTPKQPVTMMTKLEMVAGFENLTDAIFALGQWVKQAAKDEEIELFCRAEKTSALPTVVRRGISSEIEDPKRFEAHVKPALLQLLMAVLNRCGIGEDEGEAKIEETMGTMLKQARKVTLLASNERNIEEDETVIGDRVARFIVSRLAIAMDEIKEYNKHNKDKDNNDDSDNCQQEERAGSTNAGNDIGNENNTAMASLLSQRDALKAEATCACTTLQNSMKSMFSDTTTTATQDQTTSTTSSRSIENIQDVALHIVDQNTKHILDNEKVRLETLKSQIRKEGQSSGTVQSLVESKLSLQTKRRGYQEKIAELRAALAELESQETDAAIQIEHLSKQIGEEKQNDDMNTKQLEQEIIQAKESVHYGSLVNGLAGIMKTYGKALENATAFKTGYTTEQETSNSGNEKGNNKTVAATAEPVRKELTLRAMEDYLSKIRSYFLNEAHCATHLQHRLATKTVETTVLKSELSQYNSVKSLFSTESTITAQIEAFIAQNERTIQADTRRIAAITDDGRLMYDALLAMLDTYSANTMLEDFFPTELLKGVPAAIRALNIVVHDCGDIKLVLFVKEEQGAEDTADETMTIQSSALNQDCEGNNDNDGAAPSISELEAEGSASSHRSTITVVAVAPKLAWASPGAKVTTPKRSLLDIQKEELDRSMEISNTQSRDDKSNEQE